MKTVVWSSLIAAALWSSTGFAQTPLPNTGDTARVHALDTVVVTPERSATRIRTSTVAVSVISGQQLRLLPIRSVATALAMAPGVVVVDANSVGGNPRVIARGFYGGGETDYLLPLMDGVPIAALGSGAVDWDLLTRGGAGRLEVVRGGSSYIRGDAAIAGTANLLTDAQASSWRLAGGSRDIRDATVAVAGGSESNRGDLSFDHTASRGEREHEQRKSSTLNARLTRYGESGTLSLFASTHFRDFDDPGPLPSTITDRRAGNPFFRFDHAAEQVHRGGISVARAVGAGKGSGYLVAEYATARTTKTLPLATDFADTKLRRTNAPRILASTQLELGEDSARTWGRVVAGVDASVGRFTSRYADVTSGTPTDYAAADGSAGAASAPSRTTRQAAAAFAHWQLRPLDPLRISLSTRFDQIHDRYRAESASPPTTFSASHQAVSPRAALNLALPASARITTNAFVSFGGVFKAPTLDQLFDDRVIPIPFPPFGVTTSNPDLSPQRGRGVEGGLYSTLMLVGDSRLDISVAAYDQRMRDELDFDVNTFRYINIGRSLHRGLELGASLTAGRALVFANFARQRVVAQSGQNDGRQLKAIPRTIASAGADLPLWRAVTVGALVSSVGGAFVDDGNLVPLRGYARADLRVGIPAGPLRVTFDLMNALDKKYDATAFPDPAGSAVVYRYPAAGRVFVLGLESR